MSLLAVTDVAKRYNDRRSTVAVRRASFTVDRGEFVTIWGDRRSGRSTLLRIAAGAELPDTGTVAFDGVDLAEQPALGRGIGLCATDFSLVSGRTVGEQVGLAALRATRRRSSARIRAEEALDTAGATDLAQVDVRELHPAERVRTAIARVLAAAPRLIVIDDPALEVGVLDADDLHQLLRTLANGGIAVLATVSDIVPGSRTLTIASGELQGMRERAPADVIELRRGAI